MIEVKTFVIILLVWMAVLTMNTAFLNYKVIGKPHDIITTTTPTVTTTVQTKVDYPMLKCEIKEAILYYLPTCPHCQRQLTDGTYDSLVKSGVSVELKDVTKGNYNVTYIPDWFVEGKDNYGYQTWGQLKELFRCK